MKQSDLQHFRLPESVGFSGDQIDLAVHALDHAAGVLPQLEMELPAFRLIQPNRRQYDEADTQELHG